MTKFINFVSLKGSTVLSAKESSLLHSSHHQSKRYLAFLFISVFSLLLVSCSQQDEIIPNKHLTTKITDKKSEKQALHSRRPSYAPYGWTRINGKSGIARFDHTVTSFILSRNWHVIKVWLPEIKISPICIPLSRWSRNPWFQKRSLREWLNYNMVTRAEATINSSFFATSNKPTSPYFRLRRNTKIAHAFGSSNRTISRGLYNEEEEQMTFYVRNNRAYITTKKKPRFFETFINGLSIAKNKKKYERIGRTIIGIPSNGSQSVYIFVTGSGGGATQNEAKLALQRFGCQKFIMLDGGGSSIATWGNSQLVRSTDPSWSGRRVPALLGMFKR